jgi:hypothetical protein
VLGTHIYYQSESASFEALLKKDDLDCDVFLKLLDETDWSLGAPYSLPRKYCLNLHRASDEPLTRTALVKVIEWLSKDPGTGTG